jgi:hypothetical protein
LGRSSAAAGMAAEGREPLAIRGQDDPGPRVLRRCCPVDTNFLCGEISGLNRSTIARGSFNHPVLIRVGPLRTWIFTGISPYEATKWRRSFSTKAEALCIVRLAQAAAFSATTSSTD